MIRISTFPVFYVSGLRVNLQTNNSIKYAKRQYFNDNLAANKKDPCKTWQLINELNSCQPKKKVIADIEIRSSKVSSSSEMADAFNCYFANIGHDLVRGCSHEKTCTGASFIPG